jgi:hypothetical protein
MPSAARLLLAAAADAATACGGAAAGNPAATASPAGPTAAQLAALTRYAQCLRGHGVPDFPDPDPRTGSYPTTSDPTREPDWSAATHACQQLAPQGKSRS